MLYLILAVLLSSSISLIMRAGEKHVKNNFAMFLANYIICASIAGTFLLTSGNSIELGAKGFILAVCLGAVGGILFLSSFVFMKYNIERNGVMLSTVFMKLGVLVPSLMAVVIFRESPTAWQIIGFVIAIAAIIIIYLEPKQADGTKSGVNDSIVYLIALLLLSGLAESLANIYDKLGTEEMRDLYMFCIFACAAILSGLILIIKRQPVCWKDLLFGVLIGIPNYFCTRFLLLALTSVPAVVTYPVYNIGAIIIVGIIGALLFKEKLNIRKAIGFGLIMAALVFLNI